MDSMTLAIVFMIIPFVEGDGRPIEAEPRCRCGVSEAN
jgi:hypothetical protein